MVAGFRFAHWEKLTIKLDTVKMGFYLDDVQIKTSGNPMAFSTLELSFETHVAHLTLNRPEAYNSFNRDFWREFPEALGLVAENSEARVLVLFSSGKHFSAGMDLEIFQKPDPRLFSGEAGRKAEQIRRLVLELQDCFTALENLRIPVLVAVQGGCIGGALDLVCACDSRYCTNDAYFTIKETQLGMVADLGTLQRLPKLIPEGLARELAFTGRRYEADEAQRSGFVNRVFESVEEMQAEVLAVAYQIAGQSPVAVAGTKSVLNYSRDHSVRDGLEYVATLQSGFFQPTDMMESFAAKAQRREPEFENLKSINPVMTGSQE